MRYRRRKIPILVLWGNSALVRSPKSTSSSPTTNCQLQISARRWSFFPVEAIVKAG